MPSESTTLENIGLDFFSLGPETLESIVFVPYQPPGEEQEGESLMDMNTEGADILAKALRLQLSSILSERGLYSTYGLELAKMGERDRTLFEAASEEVVRGHIESAGLMTEAFTPFPPRLVMEADHVEPVGALAVGPQEGTIEVAKWRHVRSTEEAEEVAKASQESEGGLDLAFSASEGEAVNLTFRDAEDEAFEMTIDSFPDRGGFLLCALPEPQLLALLVEGKRV